MAYELVKQEALAASINRIFEEEIAASIATLENPGDSKEEAIHSVRKHIKKIRALLRLVKNQLDTATFKQENIRYRNISHLLSHLRDATVMIQTLTKLKQAYPNQISPTAYRKARKILVERQNQASKAFFDEGNNIEQVLRAFQEAQQQRPSITLREDSYTSIAPNMKAIYRQAIKELEVATYDPNVHNLHELRKQVKHLGYHTRLLSPIWPVLFGAYAKELDRLAEFLGDDHDLGILHEEIASGRLPVGSKETISKLLALIDEQRGKLLQEIYALAQRLFAERAQEFIDRYELHWKVWQQETTPV